MHVMGSVSLANERERFSLQGEGVAVAVPTSPPPPRLPSGFSDIEDNQTKPPPPASLPLPPPPPPASLPPPPPPPPLPLPPPPPLLPGLGDPVGGKKRRVRSFFWKTIPEHQVKGRANLWTRGQVQHQYQIDVQTIEELFGQNDRQSNAKATLTRGGKTKSSFREAKEEVSILDSKRGMNIGIFLKQFKRANQTIVDDIHHGNSEPYGAKPLRDLLKLLPEDEEVEKLKSYAGDVSKLSLADSFVYLLIQLPSYSVRVESMLLKEEFPAVCEAMKRDINNLRSATKELMCCEELHAVLHLVLQAGNILNAGGFGGNAVGFKLSSLLTLADTKANKPGMNLLHFVAQEAEKKDKKLLEFPLKLSHVPPAARISLVTLDGELECLTSRTDSVKENVKTETELLQQLDSFLQSAALSLSSLRDSRQQLQTEGSELIDFFCEDRETFRLDDGFSIFHNFCCRFTDAVKENTEREAKEAARRQRLQELEERKRHSWAGEEVGEAFRLRCSSEADVSATVSRHNDAELLVELLTTKSRPRSPPNNSHNPLGYSGSLRRSRHSPSTSAFIAAERELSMLLGVATPDDKVAQQRGEGDTIMTAFPSASSEPGLRGPGLSPQTRRQSPRDTTCSFPQNQQPQADQMAPQTPSSPPETSVSALNANHTTATYLSYDATQTRVNTINPTNEVTVKPTSDPNQQSDHNNNEKDRLDLGFSSPGTPSDHQTQSGLRGELARMNKPDQDFSGQIARSDEKFERSTGTAGNMSVVLEKCTLVPELNVFDEVTTPSSLHQGPHISHLHGYHLDDTLITVLEEEGVDKSPVQKVRNNSKIWNVQISETCSSSSQREEEEGREEKVAVWCVTGVCEAADELAHADNTHVQTEKDQCRSDNQQGSQQTSSAPANRTPSEPQLANEKSVPVPISSQPVPVSRCDNPSLPVSSPMWHPAEPASANEAPALTADASEEAKEPTNRREEAEGSTNAKRDVETLPAQSTDTTNENTEAASSTKGKAKPATLSKPSTKNLPTSTTQPAGIRPATPNAASADNKYKPVRTLTSSEDQSMRRVVPISRTSRSALSLRKRPEKTPGNPRGSSSTTSPASLAVNVNSTSIQREERPSTAPSSRRSSLRTPDSKDSKDQKVSGTSAQEQNQESQRKPAIRKPITKPKPQPEEKMCRSTLRALIHAAVSASAPATPMHKATTPSSSLLPSFAQNTASSSFRRTNSTLAPPAPSHSPHSGSHCSPKSSPKTTSSSVAPPGTSSHFTLTGVSAPSKCSDSLNLSSSSPLRRSQTIRATPHSLLHDSLVSPKGLRRHNSGTFSDKSNNSRDSVKSTRPSWR